MALPLIPLIISGLATGAGFALTEFALTPKQELKRKGLDLAANAVPGRVDATLSF